MYKSLIKSYGDYPNSVQINNCDFIIIAELEAILYALALLIKLIQTNKCGCNSYSFVLCFRTFVYYVIHTVWHVVEVNTSNVDPENHWHGGAIWPLRDWRGIPLDPFCLTKNTGLKTVKLVKRKTTMLSTIAQQLTRRIEVEFQKYNCVPTSNQLLALACNPLSVQLGLQELEVSSKLLNNSGASAATKSLAIKFHVEAKKLLEQELREVYTNKFSATSTTDIMEEYDEEDPCISARKEIARETANEIGTNSITEQINGCFSHQTKLQWRTVCTVSTLSVVTRIPRSTSGTCSSALVMLRCGALDILLTNDCNASNS
jgi:hypothetical protein